MRRHLRFNTHALIELQFDDRNALRSVWMTDISKGGLFVETSEPPPLFAKVTVEIETPDGRIQLRAEVVRILTEEQAVTYGCRPGVGLQFTDLDPARRRALEEYTEGLEEKLLGRSTEDLESTGCTKDLVDRMQAFLDASERDDLYGAIGAGPLASGREIEAALQETLRSFQDVPGSVSAAQRQRIEHASAVAKRSMLVLLDPDRRLDYDFRHGLLLVDERREQSPGREELHRLRLAWMRHFRTQVLTARAIAEKALQLAHLRFWDRAIEAGKQALAQDPFNVELRAVLEEWRGKAKEAEAYDRRSGRVRSAPSESKWEIPEETVFLRPPGPMSRSPRPRRGAPRSASPGMIDLDELTKSLSGKG